MQTFFCIINFIFVFFENYTGIKSVVHEAKHLVNGLLGGTHFFFSKYTKEIQKRC